MAEMHHDEAQYQLNKAETKKRTKTLVPRPTAVQKGGVQYLPIRAYLKLGSVKKPSPPIYSQLLVG